MQERLRDEAGEKKTTIISIANRINV